jgi:hypothetical protein
MKLIYIFLLFINSFALNINNLNFNLEKNSLMISHILKPSSINKFNLLLPKNQIIQKSKVFSNDKLDYRFYYNIFNVKTKYFNGDRFEVITITKNIKTNKLSFVILDCFTNTITWDPIDNIKSSNVLIYKTFTSNKYDILVKSKSFLNSKSLFKLKSLKSNKYLDTLKEFTITPNYICYFKNYFKPYKLDFNNNLNLTVQILHNIKFTNNIYNEDIKKTEHFFIYPEPMDFTVNLND